MTTTSSCPCGCDQPVKLGRKYATTSCYWRGNREHMARMGKLAHAKTGRRQQLVRYPQVALRKRSLERARGLRPAEAYMKGYHNGYKRAYSAWKAWAEQEVRRLACQRSRAQA
jgi:hypothetical protein